MAFGMAAVAEHPSPSSAGGSPSKGSEAGPLHRALFNYEPADDDELSFLQGEEIEVLCKYDEEVGEGWWQGRKGSKVGWFPQSYVSADSIDNEYVFWGEGEGGG